MIQGALLLELGVGAHDCSDLVAQNMTDGGGVTGANEIMNFTG